MQENNYTGFMEVELDEASLSLFYTDFIPNNINHFKLLENQYLIIRDEKGTIIDKYKWHNNEYKAIPFYAANSKMFGKVAPKNGDIYQQLALDSLYTNQVTIIRGKPGSGKSYLALSYLISLWEKGEINKIVIFANPVAVRGAAKLGFYPGDKNTKLLDSQIGNFLVSKLGSMIQVEKMIEEEDLLLIPVADCRGMDLSGTKAGVLITEAQNTSIDIMKLILQRIGEDCIVVAEGDDKTQVDMNDYRDENNGLCRMSEVFRGHDIYGEVTLQTIYRSKIAEIAEEM